MCSVSRHFFNPFSVYDGGLSLLETVRNPANAYQSRSESIFHLGVCKTRTGYLRMADADGKMRIEKCGWKKKTRITKKLRRKKTRNADNKKKKE